MTRREDKIIFIIIFLTILASLAYSFYFQIQPLVDAKAYDTIGWNIAQGLGYRVYLNTSLEKDPAIGRVGPAYEFFLGGVYFIFGHNIKIVWVTQAILRGLSVLLLYFICLKIFGRDSGSKIGVWAGILFGFYPDLIEISAMIMTETLAIFLLLLIIYLFLNVFQEPTWQKIILLAIIFVAGVSTRSNFALMLIVFVGSFLYQKRYQYLLIFLTLIFILMAPWTIRNYKLYHQFIPTCAAGGYDLWVGNNPQASGELENYKEIDDYMKENGIVATNIHGTQQALNFIQKHPLKFIWLLFRKTTIYFSILRPIGFWFHLAALPKALTLISSGIFSIIIFIFGLAGVFFALREKNVLIKPLLFLALCMPLGVIPLIVETRYRYPIYPFLAILAAFYIYKFIQKNPQRYDFLLIAVVVIFSIALFDGVVSFERIKERIELINIFKFLH